eukprot:CAMPEP_0177581108 /NCGR_PEP_ID=MMETSP0419_2-20121207/1961_1 /TAXON_ID=582737 /ORGANISM="Tetraselmis sp., Strain GSL018" /LENGTH=248 /DNA_ID=CAMNT_0019070107 /DNA_START=112 /DNA_END=859 /DNA_ORIENTATION=-
MSNTFQVIDGSILEGGGQILRIASALSAITSKSIQIDKIRQGRSKAGLRPQHLTGVKLVSDMSSAVCSGLTVGSQQVLMSPGPLQIRNIPYSADTGTAGSCVLLAQAALPCALYCSAQGTTTALTRMHLTGGTDAELAPPIGYMQHVLLPMLKRLLAVDAGARLERRGFYPKGGGRVMLEVSPLSPGSDSADGPRYNTPPPSKPLSSTCHPTSPILAPVLFLFFPHQSLRSQKQPSALLPQGFRPLLS